MIGISIIAINTKISNAQVLISDAVACINTQLFWDGSLEVAELAKVLKSAINAARIMIAKRKL